MSLFPVFTPAFEVYLCDAVVFDGSDSAIISAGFSGPPADAKLNTVSFWIKSNRDGTTIQRVMSHSSGGHGMVLKQTTNKMFVEIYNPSTPSHVSVVYVYSSSDWLVADGWNHFLFAVDSDDDWYMYKNGSDDKGTETTFTAAASYDFSWNREVFGAYQTQGTQFLEADIAEFYYTNEFINDPTKFRSASGKPISLGADGSLPSGTAPIVYLHVDVGETANNFYTNAGTGGNYAATGTLTTASTSPSD